MKSIQSTIKIHFLKYHPEHVETCARWSFNTWGHHTPGRTFNDYIISRKECLNDDKLPLTFIAFDGKTPIGMCSLSASKTILPELTPWLSTLYVQPDWRNKGVGTLLEHAICAQASRMGYANIYCFTSDTSVIPWYEKLSWSKKCVAQIHNHEVTVLEKILV